MNNKKPSRIFDEKYGTKFSKQWLLPSTLTSNRLWELVKMWKDSFEDQILDEICQPLCDEIIKLNSYKGEVKGSYGNGLIDFLMGVASEFDDEDINEFIVLGGGIHRNKEWQTELKKVELKYTDLCWIPSLSKLKFLNSKILK